MPPANAGEAGLILGSGRLPGEGNGKPVQYSGLGNPMNRTVPWTGGLQSMGLQRVRHTRVTEHDTNQPSVNLQSLGLNNLALFAFFQREFPVPEQFKTAWDGAKLITEPTEIMVSERPPKPLT